MAKDLVGDTSSLVIGNACELAHFMPAPSLDRKEIYNIVEGIFTLDLQLFMGNSKPIFSTVSIFGVHFIKKHHTKSALGV